MNKSLLIEFVVIFSLIIFCFGCSKDIINQTEIISPFTVVDSEENAGSYSSIASSGSNIYISYLSTSFGTLVDSQNRLIMGKPGLQKRLIIH
jgi:hypothetical protein